MRRGGDAAAYLALIRKMREIVPEIAVRTTFIVGFPGEGEAEYEELVQFVREAELDNVGAFAYSPEPGSGSEPLGDPVPAAEKERRREFLLSLQQPISRGRLRRLKGAVVPAIVEGASEESEYLLEGRLRSQAPEIDGRLLITDVADRALSAGDVVSVRIERTFDYDVSGAVVS
jgi:ribosomal protein S12 methylthiotransferase